MVIKGIQDFLSNDKQYPVIYAIAAGLYPILFYYSNNFTLVNSWSHLAYFILMFLLVPIVFFIIAHWLSKHIYFRKWQKYILPYLSIFVFLILLKVCLFGGFQKKISLAILAISLIFAFVFYKHIKKLVVIQFILAIIGIYTLTNTIIRQFSYSKAWMQQPDDIEQVIFKKRPNVYYLQPDGYVNASELKRGFYNFENETFDHFLADNKFKYYENFRSNYAFTLSSNSSSLMMKHHYYNDMRNYSEILNDREIVMTKNTVLDVFKNNGYKTYFITEMPYLILNRPKLGWDYCSLNYDDVSFIGRGLGEFQDIISPLKQSVNEDSAKPKFFFVQILAPSHINGSKVNSKGAVEEKKIWRKHLKRSNEVLMQTISIIKEKDPNALILIMADHGGYVGMNYTLDALEKTEDRDKIYSIFSSILAIHWPDELAPAFDENMKSSVNVFRFLFSYLSEDTSYLKHLQPDNSYAIIKKGAEPGVYQYIDGEGNVTFKKQ